MKKQTKNFPYSDRYSFLWLAVALVLTLFSTGKLAIPIAAWLSTIFALRFMRTQKRGIVGYLLISLVISVSVAISWRGMIAIPPPGDIAFIIITGLVAGIPFLADRWLAHRLKGLWVTLVFPLASTALEFLNMGSGSPVGSFGAVGYTQYNNLILLQLLSITGMWGLSFLMSWLASMVNWAWEQSFEWSKIRHGVVMYGGILLLVLIYGGARLTFARLEPATVRVASLTAVSTDLSGLMSILKSDRDAFSQKTVEFHESYFEHTIKEARAGAKIILWPEGAGICTEEDESTLMDRGKAITKQEGIYLAIPFFTMYEDENHPPENKLIIFDPSGNQAMEHIKYGGNIFEGSKLGDCILKTIETPYGTLSGVICWDTDFINNVAQSGRNSTDILLSPAHDWREIDPLHGQMTAYRAIENGISVIRQADMGFSVVTDPYGRTLASMDHYTASDRTMVAQVPTKGVRTIYSIIGDLFGWLSTVGFVAIAIWAVIRWRRGQKIIIGTILLAISVTQITAQETFKQNIRGTVVDAVTGYALIGANVILMDSDPIVGTSTDKNGQFLLEDILLGRQSIEVRYIGYANQVIPNLYLSSGKETQVQVNLKENAMDMEEVIVRYSKRKDKAQNEMAMVSSRTFSVEETERFAGSLGDPARMVANYAGVMTHNDSRNDIIIRGNSPIGVLWRLEGIEIPNPNHFGALGTTGGPVSMVNNNLLANSDFLTGAFPAEFGNATAGVFDLNMRSGNSGKHEFTGQVGFNGFEAGIEGPFATVGETQKATYLANYRYSTLGLLNDIGFNFGTGAAIPQYQDFTFLVDLPGTKIGRWKVFGLWGKSFIELGREPEDTTSNSYNPRGTATDFGSSLGVIGLSNTYFINHRIRLKTTVSYQQTAVTTVLDSTKNNLEIVEPFVRQNQAENRFSVTTQLRHKVNAKNNYSLGIVLDHYYINYVDSVNHPNYNKFITTSDVSGTLGLARAYAQWQHAFSNQLTGYAGIHTQYFNLNQELSWEPRMALTWQPRNNNTFSLGYGLHSQIQPKSVYFYQTYDELNDRYFRTNENVGFTKSHHVVLGYDHLFSNNFRVKSETYFQYLFNIPVSNSFGEFSLVNAGDFFAIPTVDSLENTGTGSNYGIELTVEKFLSNGYYILFTTSLFDSKYKGGDGITRNTAFNGNYVFNLLAGYEKKIGEKTYLTIDLKGVLAGGRRYVPIDVDESLEEGFEVRDWSRAYQERYGDYFRTDLRLGLKVNNKRFSQEWAIDLQNLTGYQSLFMEGIDLETGEIYQVYQQGFMPMFLYRIQF